MKRIGLLFTLFLMSSAFGSDFEAFSSGLGSASASATCSIELFSAPISEDKIGPLSDLGKAALCQEYFKGESKKPLSEEFICQCLNSAIFNPLSKSDLEEIENAYRESEEVFLLEARDALFDVALAKNMVTEVYSSNNEKLLKAFKDDERAQNAMVRCSEPLKKNPCEGSDDEKVLKDIERDMYKVSIQNGLDSESIDLDKIAQERPSIFDKMERDPDLSTEHKVAKAAILQWNPELSNTALYRRDEFITYLKQALDLKDDSNKFMEAYKKIEDFSRGSHLWFVNSRILNSKTSESSVNYKTFLDIIDEKVNAKDSQTGLKLNIDEALFEIEKDNFKQGLKKCVRSLGRVKRLCRSRLKSKGRIDFQHAFSYVLDDANVKSRAMKIRGKGHSKNVLDALIATKKVSSEKLHALACYMRSPENQFLYASLISPIAKEHLEKISTRKGRVRGTDEQRESQLETLMSGQVDELTGGMFRPSSILIDDTSVALADAILAENPNIERITNTNVSSIKLPDDYKRVSYVDYKLDKAYEYEKQHGYKSYRKPFKDKGLENYFGKLFEGDYAGARASINTRGTIPVLPQRYNRTGPINPKSSPHSLAKKAGSEMDLRSQSQGPSFELEDFFKENRNVFKTELAEQSFEEVEEITEVIAKEKKEVANVKQAVEELKKSGSSENQEELDKLSARVTSLESSIEAKNARIASLIDQNNKLSDLARKRITESFETKKPVVKANTFTRSPKSATGSSGSRTQAPLSNFRSPSSIERPSSDQAPDVNYLIEGQATTSFGQSPKGLNYGQVVEAAPLELGKSRENRRDAFQKGDRLQGNAVLIHDKVNHEHYIVVRDGKNYSYEKVPEHLQLGELRSFERTQAEYFRAPASGSDNAHRYDSLKDIFDGIFYSEE